VVIKWQGEGKRDATAKPHFFTVFRLFMVFNAACLFQNDKKHEF
jgi:hypothetical protein